MAAPAVPLRGSGPPLCPSFAEVCSFLERYGPALDLPEMTFPQMERYLRDTTAVPKPLVELHVKLLRKLGRSVTTDRWEKYLAKVCQELNSTWAWELERKGYQEMSMECKASILKYLCECQFDDNLKFKMVVNDEDPEKMRLQPVGRDRQGLMYWLQLDQDQNIRLYTEEQDDQDGSTWTCIVRTRNDLAEALELLKAQIDPNHSQDQDQNQNQNQDQDQNQNQAGSRSSSPTQKETGSEAVGSRDPEASKAAEQNTDSKKVEAVKEEKPLIPVLKQEVSEAVKEECVPPKPSVIDNRVSTITAVIKSEPRDAADAPRNAVSVVMAPGSAVMKQEASREEEERAVVRSNQQAKIPLKKRELKLAESFHSNHLSSSIIVCNPAVIQSTDGKPPGSLAPPGGPTASQQQLVASRQELTNGRTSLLLPHKDGHNGVIGVIGQVGVIGHIGVIQRTSEQQELNGPILDLRSCRAADEEREASRQSVLVRKGLSDPPAATDTPRKTLKHDQKPEATDRTGEAGSSQSTEETRRPEPEDQEKTTEEQADEEKRSPQQDEGGGDEEKRSPQQDEGGGDEASRQPATGGGRKGNEEEDKMEEEPGDAATPLEEDQKEKKEQEEKEEQKEQEEKEKEKNQNQKEKNQREQREQREQRQKELQAGGVNGALAAQVRLKDIGSEGRKGPLEEASSELQKEGIRLKIKIPPHRRNKLKKGGKEEEKERQQEAQEEGRPLRRSARICRPSSKAAESQRKKPPRKPTQPTRRREEEEEDEEDEEEEEEQSPATKKDGKAGAVGPTRKRRGKRRHRRPRWSNVRTKRRKPNEDEDRGRRRGEEDSDGGSESEDDSCKSEEVPSEDACTHCGLPNHPELILLCDSCDSGFHTACLRPPLMLIPDGEWFCPPCQHKLLCEKLEEQLLNLDSALKKKERAERRRERLVYVGISVENIIPEGDEEEEEEQKSAKKKDSKKSKNLGRRSTRTRKHISYRFDDFDDAIDEAIEEDFRDLCGGTGRGTDITAILSEDGKETQRPIRSQTHTARSRRRRRLNDLESDSTAAESEDEFLISNSSEDEDFGASAADDDDEEDEDGGSDVGSWDSGTRPRRAPRAGPKHKPNRTQQRGRKRPRRRRRRSSEEEEEDSEEDMDSDQFSDMTDSDADKKRRGLRRGQRQQVNYRETSESSDNSRTSARKERPKARGRPRKERLSSDYSDASPSSKDSEEEDYDDEEEDEQRRRVYRRRRDDKDERRNRTRGKRRYEDEEDEGEGGQRMKRRPSEEEERRRRRMKRTDQEEEEPQRMGRGRRREMLTQQRRRRLAMMLKKRRPSTDEDESDESESSSEEDRPVRKRLNRIDSDDDEEEDEEEEEGRQRSRKCSERKADSDTQEKGRGQSPSPHGHRSSRGPERPGDREGQGRHNGPLEEEEEEQEEQQEEQQEEHTDRVDSALKALQS